MSEEKEKDKGIINESVNKIKDFVNEKLSSPFWVSFIVAWLICNWKFWYVTFFIDEKLLMENKCLLKTDYIDNFYNWDFLSNDFWLYRDLIFPIIISLIIYFVMSYLVDLFHWKAEKNRKKGVLRVFETNKEIEDEKEKLLSDTLIKKQSNTEKEKSIRKIEEKSKTQQEIWDKEYEIFKQSEYFKKLDEIKKCIYSTYGRTYYNGRNSISIDAKTYFSVNKIIEIYFEDGTEKIRLTNKGSHYMKKFLDDQPKGEIIIK